MSLSNESTGETVTTGVEASAAAVVPQLRAAEDAMRHDDHDQAIAALRAIDLGAVPPSVIVGVEVALGRVEYARGAIEQSVAHYRNALFGLAALGTVTRDNVTAELLSAAQAIAIGAQDVGAAKNLMAFSYPAFFATPREVKISRLVDIRSWCADRGIEIATIEPARRVDLPSGAYDADEAWSARIPDAEIIAGWDFVMTPSGEVLHGGNYMPLKIGFDFMPHLYHRDTQRMAHVWDSGCIRIDEDVLFLSTPESHHYGHWITDFLPRLRAWNVGQAPVRKVMISSALPAKHRDLLARFGVARDDLVECDPGRRYAFRSLTVVRAGGDFRPRPGTVSYLRASLMRGYKPDDVPRRKFFMIRDAGTRLPVNREDLAAVLAKHGVESVNPARWSVEEQERNLAQARVIIAVYGTELLCLFNLRAGGHVVELTLDEPGSAVFAPMSGLSGLNHHVIRCQRSRTGRVRRKNDSNVIVDCAALDRVLSGIGD